MFYSNSSLDRADHLRKQETELKRLRHQDTSLLVPVWQGQSLTGVTNGSKEPQALMLDANELHDSDTVFLGRHDDHHFFAVDISTFDEGQRDHLILNARTRSGVSAVGEFKDLRGIGPILNDEDGSLLAYARALIYWNANTRFCHRCGNALTHHYHGHQRRCQNDSCGYLLFPRTDPAVIMLVVYSPPDNGPELCLLGRAAAWPDGVYSTLAGFVEPGESLEMAVSREVLEEASITTQDVRYVASQPWPFPRSIMLGFEATATSCDIICDPDELADAQWFSRAQIRQFDNWGDDTDNYKLPRTDSIARHLINLWLNRETAC